MHQYSLLCIITPILLSFQLAPCMDHSKAAFAALEQKDYKTLVQLRKEHKIPLHLQDSNGISLLTRVIAASDVAALSALIDEQQLTMNDRTLVDVRDAIQFPEIIIHYPAVGDRAVKDFNEIDRDTIGENFVVPQQPLRHDEMMSIALANLLVNYNLSQDLMNSFIDSGADDYINRPLSDGTGSNCHEKLWIYYMVNEKDLTRRDRTKEIAASLLLPHFSSRAFEHVDYLFDSKDHQDKKNADYFHAKHAEWKIMSKQRTELVKQHISPCTDIVKDYLEGDEAKRIREELVKAIQRSYNDVNKGYSKALKPKTVESNADLIMHYIGIYGKSDDESS